ncbi:unnamed protein product [Trifolium pratense]|uniref:Uncharacterized protein n=1 Tax=Trifolium pratense TaxID=57577 RepID=A0ACB0K2T2_TRIPR|nr:unnamed protein product [Trifolium pratense]
MVNKFAKYLEAFLSLFSISDTMISKCTYVVEGCLICMLKINGGNSHNYDGLELKCSSGYGRKASDLTIIRMPDLHVGDQWRKFS